MKSKQGEADTQGADAPGVPFNKALKQVWAHKPMPKVKKKPAPSKSAQAKPKKGDRPPV